jgi:uncharacterized protein (TIGR02145 family)
MSNSEQKTTGLVPVGFSGLQRISNSLRITEKLIQSTKVESVFIGTQEWMLRNLDVGTFINGDLIQHIEGMGEWLKAGKEGIPAWCDYDNNPENGRKYGKLYNWHAVNDLRGLAPSGWKIPSKEDFLVLVDAFGGIDVAGRKMKAISDKPNVPEYEPFDHFGDDDNPLRDDPEALEIANSIGQTFWDMHYREIVDFKMGTNESGFEAYLAGFRMDSEVNAYADFNKGELVTLFWCRDGEENNEAGCVALDCASDDVGLYSSSKVHGYSVRCIRDITK